MFDVVNKDCTHLGDVLNNFGLYTDVRIFEK